MVLLNAQQLNDHLSEIVTNYNEKIRLTIEVRDEGRQRAEQIRNMLLTGDEGQLERYRALFDASVDRYTALIIELDELVSDEEEQRMMDRIRRRSAATFPVMNVMMQNIMDGFGEDSLQTLQNEGAALQSELLEALSAFVRLEQGRIDRASREAERTAREGLLAVLATSIIIFLSILLTWYLLSRQITGPIVALSREMERVTEERDLSKRLSVKGRDEIGHARTAWNCLLDMLEGSEHELSSEVEGRKRVEGELALRANFDALTGLPNRAHFLDRLDRAIWRAGRSGCLMALLFLDLDRFKPVNDAYGHATGDQLLQQVSTRLQGVIRQSDILARIGGDEFGLVVEDIRHVDDAAMVAESLVGALSEPFRIDGIEMTIGISIGITIFPVDDRSSQKLIHDADIAMYRAKEGGSSYEFYSLRMSEEAHQRMSMLQQLRRAVEEQQFVLHYQPQVDSITRKMLGVEALLRWNHPHRGVIYPALFMPLLEESRLIVEVGRWVLAEAIGQHERWMAAGYPALRISVNVSPLQFGDPHFNQMVRDEVVAGGINAAWLKLEITESVMVEGGDINAVKSTLEQLRLLGVKVAMDDFGTGFSSLQYLQKLPFDVIKLDRGFVGNALVSDSDRVLLQTMINMAKGLGLDTIAEGVENGRQAALLERMGATELQGFFFGRPVAASVIAVMLEQMVREESGYRIWGGD